MRTKDIALTSSVAVLTMLGALFAVAPAPLNASADDVPTVDVNGVSISVVTSAPRRRPTAKLTLVNTTEDAVVVSGTLTLYETSLASMGGRMAMPSKERWNHDCLFVLNAGEEKTVELRAGSKLRPNTMGHFTFAVKAPGEEVLYTESFVPRGKKDKEETAVAALAPRPLIVEAN